MELVYIRIDKYRTFHHTELSLTNKFAVRFDLAEKKISIEENSRHYNIYPEPILNVSAIVGKNASGKSNLFDLIGMRIDDRNKLNEEREILREQSRRILNMFNANNRSTVINHYQYFMLYYIGKNADGENLYCIEGNNIEQYSDLFLNSHEIDCHYFQGKYWFSVICTYVNGKLFYQDDVQQLNVSMSNKRFRSLKDVSAIILFKENYNPQYYDYRSFDSDDEFKIAIPRRNSKLTTDFVYKKIEFLINQMQKSNRALYKNKLYTLQITFDKESSSDILGIKDVLDIDEKDELTDMEFNMCYLLSNFCLYFAGKVINARTIPQDELKDLEADIGRIVFEKICYVNIRSYYEEVFHLLIDYTVRKWLSDKEIEYLKKVFLEFYTAFESVFLSTEHFSNIQLHKGYLEIVINQNANIELINHVIQLTIDEHQMAEVNETVSLFQDFFDYSINFLSDGELAYLGLMATVDEQLSLKTQVEGSVTKKEKYILLFDEPETRMHPDLARTFIKTLIDFLSQYTGKTFQIIVASHSPFLISDIPKENVLMLKKDDDVSTVHASELDTFAQNIHTLLSNAFFMDVTIGAYAYQQIQYISLLLEQASEQTDWDRIEAIVDSIGEPLLKARLREKIAEKKREWMTDDLKDVIQKYEQLSIAEQEKLIHYIIQTQKTR